MNRLLLYYITDRRQFAQGEAVDRLRVLEKIHQAARCGVDFIQLREKDLSGRQLEKLGQEALEAIGNASMREGQSALAGMATAHRHVPTSPSSPNATKALAAESGCREHDNRLTSDQSFMQPPRASRLLINSRCDIALGVGADGVHLRSDDISVRDARSTAAKALTRDPRAGPRNFVVGISCHSEAEVSRAEEEGADFAVFGPIFAKRDTPHASSLGLETLRQACRHHIPVLALGGVTLDNARLCLGAGAAGVAAIRLFQDHDIATIVESLRSRQNL